MTMNSPDTQSTPIPDSLAAAAPGSAMPAQDPLAQLKDIHLPAEVSYWPPAIGWWLLVIIIIASLAAIIFFVRQKKSRNAYRAIAVAELNRAQNNCKNNADYLQALSVILRRTAISAFGSGFNPSLKGQAWLEWLDAHCDKTQQQFSQGVGTALLIGPYQKNPDFDRAALHQLAILWIKEHRNRWQRKPVKKSKSISEATSNA